MKYTYRITGSGVGHDGWWKCYVTRSDGRECKISRKRVAELRRQGRIEEVAPRRCLIQLAPDWELYLDSIDWGHKCLWTDDESRAWSWHSADHPEPIARLARIREKYPQALIVPR